MRKPRTKLDLGLQSEKVGKLEPDSGSVAPKPFSSCLALLIVAWMEALAKLYESILLSSLWMGSSEARLAWAGTRRPLCPAQARQSSQGSGARRQPSGQGSNVQSRNRGPFVWSSVGEGVHSCHPV